MVALGFYERMGPCCVCIISCKGRISCRSFFLSGFCCLLVDFCLFWNVNCHQTTQKEFCVPLRQNRVTAECTRQCVRPRACCGVSACVCVCMFELWLSDFWDYGIRPQMSRTDPKSNTHRRSLTSHTHTHASTLTRIHTIPSRTSSVSRVLHRDGLTVILPFKATHPEYTQIRPMIVLACIIKQDGWTIQHQRTFGPVKTLISPPWPQMIRILYYWDINLLSCFQ